MATTEDAHPNTPSTTPTILLAQFDNEPSQERQRGPLLLQVNAPKQLRQVREEAGAVLAQPTLKNTLTEGRAVIQSLKHRVTVACVSKLRQESKHRELIMYCNIGRAQPVTVGRCLSLTFCNPTKSVGAVAAGSDWT